MGRLLALISALIAAALIAWTSQRPPSPEPATAPAGAFSAERAMADVTAMSRQPHPMGSAANRAVRDQLVARMSALGLSPQVRPGVGVQAPKRAPDVVLGGAVENIVGVLPGRDRNAPALALMAHYDSVPGSPGSADDAAGVAAALETVRALKARGVPARDVMLVITDGEEAGLLGANAFFQRDPLARRVGFLMNMEARGSAGRVQMFQTGAENGQAVDLLRRTARRPQASSLAVFVYKSMPNDTDFTEADKAGVQGLNYAFAGRQFDYHSATSTAAALDQGTLQDMGDQVLSTASAAAFGLALPGRAPDLVYNQLFGDAIVAYPPLAGWLVLAVAAGLIALAVRRARRAEPFPWTDLLRGAGAGLFAVLGSAAVLHFARKATGVAMGYLEQRQLLAQVHRWEVAVMLLGAGFLVWAIAELARGRRNVALVPLAAGLASCAFGGLDKVGLGLGLVAAVIAVLAYGRPVTRPGAWAGVLLLGLVLGVAAQAYAPTAAAIVHWPLLLAALAAAATALAARRSYASLGILGLLAAIGLGWIGAFAHTTFVSLDLVELLGAAVLLAALLVWPLAQPEEGAPPARLIGPLLVGAGFLVMLAVRLNHPWDARYPQASYVVYQLDQDAGRGTVVSATPDLSDWAAQVLRQGGGPIAKLKDANWTRPVDAAPAAFLEETAPQIALSSADGALRLSVAGAPDASGLTLRLKPNTPAVLESLGGVPMHARLKPGAVTRIRWSGSANLDLVLRPAGPGKLEVGYVQHLPRWPAAAPPLPKRPAEVMPFDESDSTFVTGTRRFAW